MKKEEFEQQIQALIPRPSLETTTALYEMAVDAIDEDGPQRILNDLDFISRHFDQNVLQGAYEIIQHGSGALPGELVAAAVFLQAGDTPAHMAQMAEDGYLMCFHAVKEKGELSPFAICSVIEGGEKYERYTTHFGIFAPADVFSAAREHANHQGITVAQALQCVGMDGKATSKKLYEAQKIITDRWPEMAQALSSIFDCCPAVAAHITFDVDQDCVTVEYNPLWQELEKGMQLNDIKMNSSQQQKAPHKHRQKER